MKKFIPILFLLNLLSFNVRADMWGGDIPLLIQIVTNTLRTYSQLKNQTNLLKKELQGIDDVIRRFETIRDLTRPEELKSWKDPHIALNRLRSIYYTLPPQFRTQKSDEIERQIANAMSLASRMMDTADDAFRSGSQLEKDALKKGPAVANKMTASGVGTLVKLQSQQQVAQATIVSLMSQMIADSAAKEANQIQSRSLALEDNSKGLQGFSSKIILPGVTR